MMDRERWQRIEAVVDRVLEAPADERPSLIAEACEGDASLEREVEAFVASCEGADERFGAPPTDLMRAAFGDAAEGAAPDALAPGDRVGAYSLIDRIGTGGMGVVWRGERADGEFEKEVAIKVIKRGLDTEEIVERFHEERRILARLQHANVAALIDGGATDSGLPYFVMEHAAGEPIDVYVRTVCADLEERVRLFLTVCDAVQHAHRNLIVHRDLKPSNILVAGGEPKLLDFGIAKLLDPETGESRDQTRLADRRLTPSYAAPEQVLGQPVTTATDVYSLGVILYELVSGSLPYDVRGASLRDVERIVCTTDPPPPSAAAAVGRGGAPRAWKVPADLDAIVMKALQKEPDRRYVSVAAFAEDLRAFLGGRPVVARPDTALYRASKFVARNAALVGLGSAAVLALVTGLVMTGWQTRVAEQERDRREQEARTAAAARDFLLLTLRDLDPDRLAGQRTFTPAQLIERGVGNLETLSQEPGVRAPVMNTLAEVMFNLGERERADSLYRAAYTLLDAEGVHADRAVSLMGIGLARQMDLRFAEARDAYREALEMRRSVLADDDAAIAESLAALAFATYNLGSSAPDAQADSLLAEAEALYTEALALLGGASPVRARVLEGLGDIELERGNHAAAEAHYRAALRAGSLTGGPATPDDARVMWGLAKALAAGGNDDGAVRVSREALAVLERTYGEAHPDVALADYYLATHLYNSGQHGEAASVFARAADVSAGHEGAHHLFTGDALVSSAKAQLDAGRPAEALTALDRGVVWYEEAIVEMGVPPSLAAARIAVADRHRGRAWLELGRPSAALAPLRAAYAKWLGSPDQSASAADAATLLADAFERLQEPDSARHYHNRATELRGG